MVSFPVMHPTHLANALRILIMDGVEHAGSGHPGMALGMADVMTCFMLEHFSWDPQQPNWPNRDRFVLSAGHGAMLWYAALYLVGALSLEDLKSYRKYGSKTPGHPERQHPIGTEVTTGPLGQGLANAVGMALSESLLRREFGSNLVNHHTYAMVSDGCLMEGISQEAISLAGHWKLHHLTVFWDDNRITIDGDVGLSQSDDTLKRFQASGWETITINGHDYNAIHCAIQRAKYSPHPTLIACRTHIGYGAPGKMDSCHVHGSPLGASEIQKARESLHWPCSEAFFVPEHIKKAWESYTSFLATAHKDDDTDQTIPWPRKARKTWENRFQQYDLETQQRFSLALEPSLQQAAKDTLYAQKESFVTQAPKLATRASSGIVLAKILPHTRLLTGAADLKESTCTAAPFWDAFRPFLHYGIREHGMAAIMNGIAAHGGFIPCAGTFLTFSDYMRPAIRLSALMGLKVIYIMTHDSIGLGEDGPTHQPIEHIMSLRIIPNLTVLRPADTAEVVECWELALTLPGPVVLCLSRQALPTLRTYADPVNMCAQGAYSMGETAAHPAIRIWATGSEVSLALKVAEVLCDQHSVLAQVHSVPWFTRLLEHNPEPWSAFPARLHVSLEAGSTLGWCHVTGPQGLNIGIDHFGASGSGIDLFNAFGFSCSAIVERILHRLDETRTCRL
jgi:transketolase